MCGAREWEGGGRKAEEWSREKVERGDNHNHMAVSRRQKTSDELLCHECETGMASAEGRCRWRKAGGGRHGDSRGQSGLCNITNGSVVNCNIYIYLRRYIYIYIILPVKYLDT